MLTCILPHGEPSRTHYSQFWGNDCWRLMCTPVPVQFAPFLPTMQLAAKGLRLAWRIDRLPFAPSAHPLPHKNALDSCRRRTSTRYGRGVHLPGDLSWDAWPGSLPPLGSYHMSCLVMHEATAGTWPNDQMQLNQLMDLIKGVIWTACCSRSLAVLS